MNSDSAIKLNVSGRVQGVAFRWFTVKVGRALGLAGYAKNLVDGSVEIEAEGNKSDLDQFIEKVKTGPSISRVDHVKIEWAEPTNNFKNFNVKY